MQEAQRRHGSSAQLPLSQVVRALRGDRGSVLRRHATGKQKNSEHKSAASVTSLWQCTDDDGALQAVCQTILEDQGCSEDHIRKAIKCCGANVQRATEFCIRMQDGEDCDENNSLQQKQEVCRQYIADMGFPECDIIKALEQVQFDFTEALRYLLAGMEGDVVDGHWKRNMRANQLTARMQGRTSRKVKNLPGPVLRLAKEVAERQYELRAAGDLNKPELRAYDLGWVGEHGTTNACFWLCLAAGWSQIVANCPAPWRSSTRLEEATRAERLDVINALREKLHHEKLLRKNALTVLAYKLRQHFCGVVGTSPPQSLTGEICVMRQQAVVHRFFPAFAVLLGQASTQGSQMDMYKQWIKRVGCKEYADELIVAAAASELGVRIVCVPYTPQDADGPWKISTYCFQSDVVEQGRTIYLGNNDVHYMWLSSS